MRLGDRLRLLRGEPPAPLPAVPNPEPSLAERLARLRPGGGREPSPGYQEVAPGAPLPQVLDGVWVAPGVLLVERRIPLSQTHGSVRLEAGLRALGGLATRLLGEAGDPSGWCLLDTETSGLAGGTGTWVFACGLGRPQGGELVLRQYLLARLDAEPAFLAALTAGLEGCHLLVSYNGKSFDLPLLATRLRLGGMRPGFDGLAHLDLLHPIRRAFSSVWADCRLATAEARLLELRRRGDLPGAEAPQAWLNWLRRGETAGLAGVLEHNRLDLLSLAALPAPLALTLADPAQTGADPLAVAGWHRDRGDPDQAWAILEANRATLPAPLGLLELARYRLRSGDWSGAWDLLDPLAEAGDPEALTALAKLCEHRLGDLSQALILARRMPPGPERERRCRRLETRLGRSNAVGPSRGIARPHGGDHEPQAGQCNRIEAALGRDHREPDQASGPSRTQAQDTCSMVASMALGSV